MQVIYLCAGNAVISDFKIDYNDSFIKRDLFCDALNVNLDCYDVLIASPPCNYYSKANYRRNSSTYSLNTKHLLPDILFNFIATGKPFIVENVINKVLMSEILSNLPINIFYFEFGRHCYFTNIYFDYSVCLSDSLPIQNISKSQRQGNGGVNSVFKKFLSIVSQSFKEF